MSKRPKTAGSFRSRLRRPASRLRDLPIWSKLGLIMIVPTIATVVVGTSGLIDHLSTLDGANRATDLANLTDYSGALVDSLQDERAAAVLLLGASTPEAKQKYTDAYNGVHGRVDRAKAPYSQQRSRIDELPTNFEDLLDDIDQNLADLPGTRSQVFNGKLTLTAAAQSYEGLINQLLDFRDSATQLAGDTNLSERMRAAASVARAKEFLSVRRVVVHRALIQGTLTPALRTEYIATGTGQQQAQQSFQAVANQAEQEFYQQNVAGSDQRQADNYNGWISGNTSESMAAAPFDADRWDAALVANAKLIRTVEAKLDGDVVSQADRLRSDVQRQVFLETGLLLTTLLVAILFAYLVARSMARSLRELKEGANLIATHGLPHAVARLRDPKVSGQLSPAQVANQIAEPLPVRSKDEFGQVTEAFNAVHLEAVRTAAEQAALRASVATMFVNLARRSQILVDRLISHLDRLERGEEDPDRLAELFQLDHLATRMRRNDENLLVLAGADSTRVQRQPAALIDVLRAAQSEVEHYTRIEFGIIDRDIEVDAHAVNDLVHLVAELFDNATAFSPPDSQVMVEARRTGEDASLYVEDRGIGISREQLAELNERLSTPPQVDVAVSRMMGLVVVARLASRHGVRVVLRPGSERGTVAEVTLPASVLVPRALAGRPQPGALPAAPAGPKPGALPPAESKPGQFAGFGALPALGNRPASGASAPRFDDAGSRPPAGGPPPRPGESGNQVTLGGRPFDPASRNGAARPGTSGANRSVPAWSDLTGVTGISAGGADPFTPRQPDGRAAEPLPQRRGTDGDAEQAETGPPQGAAPQRPQGPQTRPDGLPQRPVPGQPVSGAPAAPAGPSTSGAPMAGPSGPAGGAPPAWPPVTGPEREPATPAVPERLAAALDMTTELPRVPRSAPDPLTSMPASAPAQDRPQYVDETMELPIFRELESAWFRTRRPASEDSVESITGPSGPESASTQQFARVEATRNAGQYPSTGTTGNAPMADASTAGGPSRQHGPAANSGPPSSYADGFATRRTPGASAGWQTAADDGWRAASAVGDAPVGGTTQTGLPKRVPMAQLVPGGVEKPAAAVQRRSPEAVRGLLSAYHRGVQRGRTQPSDGHSTNPDVTPGRQQSSQSGLGPAAGSRQKEHER